MSSTEFHFQPIAPSTSQVLTARKLGTADQVGTARRAVRHNTHPPITTSRPIPVITSLPLPLLLLLFALPACAAPGIFITNLPPFGSRQALSGLVTGIDPAACKVAAFIYVPGYGWATKPSCAEPLTPIRPDGSWTAPIALVDSDTSATRIAAVLVPNGSALPCVDGQRFITNAFALGLARTVVTRRYPGPRWLSFSGYDWWVKTSSGPVGPGPNYFSDTMNNVWVDGSGSLHLKITNRSNKWQCAEMVSARSFGYGCYRFQVLSDVNKLDRNVVLGLFTWSDDPAWTHREIDVECSRWGNSADLRNSQFVVQPYVPPGHLVRYTVPAGVTNSTHAFTWQTNNVVFQSQRGSFVPNPASSNLISGWTYTQLVPQAGDENVRLNLWLMNGNPPSDGHEVEVIIRSFEFVPPGQPSPGAFFLPRSTPGGAEFDLLSEPDRRYTVQSSPDLAHWQPELTLLATNFSIPVSLPLPDSGPVFFRALTLP